MQQNKKACQHNRATVRGKFVIAMQLLARPKANNHFQAGGGHMPLVVNPVRKASMEALITSTITVAIAEIGDKTQLLSLLLAAKFRNKLAIILGILVATLANHAVSAAFGVWLSDFFIGFWGGWIIGGSFMLVGLWLLIPDKDEETNSQFDQYGAFVVSALLFFIAEIGDKTQIATVLLGAQFQSTLIVILGTTLGMLIANVPIIYAGQKLMSKIPLNLTRMIAAIVFICLGVLSIFVN